MVTALMRANTSSATGQTHPGVDVESLDAIDISNETFITRNFTPAEIAYCRKAPSPQASFVGRWSAKEAVFKSLKVEGRGAGAALNEIEILCDEKTGAPVVQVSFRRHSFLSFSFHQG
jgi:fatty acid synthase subunit alpha